MRLLKTMSTSTREILIDYLNPYPAVVHRSNREPTKSPIIASSIILDISYKKLTGKFTGQLNDM
ncbi:MAG: hypothetical protein PHO01_09550 [Desulfotomaculaceae bacterium]|nr:hypothetical protein [Desulfotomaculaceae bacterium]